MSRGVGPMKGQEGCSRARGLGRGGASVPNSRPSGGVSRCWPPRRARARARGSRAGPAPVDLAPARAPGGAGALGEAASPPRRGAAGWPPRAGVLSERLGSGRRAGPGEARPRLSCVCGGERARLRPPREPARGDPARGPVRAGFHAGAGRPGTPFPPEGTADASGLLAAGSAAPTGDQRRARSQRAEGASGKVQERKASKRSVGAWSHV